MLRRESSVLRDLKKNHYPFTHFSDAAMSKVEEAVRLFQLNTDEQLVFPGQDSDRVLYLVDGEIVLTGADGETRLRGGEDVGPHHLNQDAGEITIRAATRSEICLGNQEMIDDVLALDEMGRVAVDTGDLQHASEMLLRLRDTKTFRTLPMESALEALNRMEKVMVAKGEEVIRQYQKGDAYYIINAGTAEVWREELDDDEPIMVAELGIGDAFGEEALVTGGARNATVVMTTDGELLRLEKEDFDELITRPLVDTISPDAAHALLEHGSKIVDVRYEEEYEESYIPGSVLIPLPDLRARLGELEQNGSYLVLCKKGVRAAAGTLLLKQRGFDAKVIAGGIVDWPYETSDGFDLELIALEYCPYAQRAIITLLHNDIPHRVTYIDPDNKPEWFEEISPLGKVPILRINEADNIFESTVINEFVGQLGGGNMLPSDPIRRTTCRSWIEYGAVCQSGLMKMVQAKDEAGYDEARANLTVNLAMVEDQLDRTGPFFLGDGFSLVDSTYAPLFVRLRELDGKAPMPPLGPRVARWQEALLDHAPVRQSQQDDFASIFRGFVARKGPGGFLDTRLP